MRGSAIRGASFRSASTQFRCLLLVFDEALAKGAESDSDAPPDERAPAFFVNEDGTKALATLHDADRLVV